MLSPLLMNNVLQDYHFPPHLRITYNIWLTTVE